MKQFIALILALCCLMGITAQAETFDAYGQTLNTEDTVLDLGKTKVTDFDELRQVINRMPNLTHVNMFNTRMERDIMAALTEEYPHILFGWTMRLGPYRVRTDQTAFSTLRNSGEKPRYTSTTYDNLRYCYQIRGIDLGHNNIVDVEFLSQLTDLQYLILADNSIVDISPLANLKKLEYLELFMNDITDLSPLTEMTGLVDLNICAMRLPDVTPLYEMTWLKRLWVSRRSPAWTEQEMQALREALPNTDINFTAGHSTAEGWRKHPRYYPVRDSFQNQSFIDWTEEQRNYTGPYDKK